DREGIDAYPFAGNDELHVGRGFVADLVGDINRRRVLAGLQGTAISGEIPIGVGEDLRARRPAIKADLNANNIAVHTRDVEVDRSRFRLVQFVLWTGQEQGNTVGIGGSVLRIRL